MNGTVVEEFMTFVDRKSSFITIKPQYRKSSIKNTRFAVY